MQVVGGSNPLAPTNFIPYITIGYKEFLELVLLFKIVIARLLREFSPVPGEFIFRRLSVADINHHNVISSETDRGRCGDVSFHQAFLME